MIEWYQAIILAIVQGLTEFLSCVTSGYSPSYSHPEMRARKAVLFFVISL